MNFKNWRWTDESGAFWLVPWLGMLRSERSALGEQWLPWWSVPLSVMLVSPPIGRVMDGVAASDERSGVASPLIPAGTERASHSGRWLIELTGKLGRYSTSDHRSTSQTIDFTRWRSVHSFGGEKCWGVPLKKFKYLAHFSTHFTETTTGRQALNHSIRLFLSPTWFDEALDGKFQWTVEVPIRVAPLPASVFVNLRSNYWLDCHEPKSKNVELFKSYRLVCVLLTRKQKDSHRILFSVHRSALGEIKLTQLQQKWKTQGR